MKKEKLRRLSLQRKNLPDRLETESTSDLLASTGRQVLVEFVEVNLYQTSGKDLLFSTSAHEFWDDTYFQNEYLSWPHKINMGKRESFQHQKEF